MSNTISFTPIGYAKTPHRRIEEIPIQPVYCRQIVGQIVVDDAYREGLTDLAACRAEF